MATYAEYAQQTMASHADFTLYPGYYQETWPEDQTYLPVSTYPDQTYLNPTTYDSFDHQQAYVQPEQFNFAANMTFNPKNGLHRPTSNYSPANSASHSFDVPNPPVLSNTSDSGASIPSTISSAIGSPSTHPRPSNEWNQLTHVSMLPGIVQSDSLGHDIFATTGFDIDTIPITDKGCVDPALIQPFTDAILTGTQFPELQPTQSPQQSVFAQAPSPVPSKTSGRSPRPSHGKVAGSASPYTGAQKWQPYPTNYNIGRRNSISSEHSRHSHGSQSSEDSNKGLCPIATCGRHVKDLKAHMLTHQNERPEKCPIPTCEYHTKGFARKYDKNRHTLTHYKGTMVCGFCPGSGSAAEKSFNRADVFKRHLTSVHGVEQTPPNARRKSPATGPHKGYGREVSGMCSTCGVTFANAQDFYEHLDDCVLRVVQQAEPSEAINEKLLGSVADDAGVRATMERHMLPLGVDFNAPTSFDDNEDDGEEAEAEDDDAVDDGNYASRAGKQARNGNPAGQSPHPRGVSSQHVGGGDHITSGGSVNKAGAKRGLTYSARGVPLAGPGATSGKGNRRRKNYPLSWGTAPEKMRMRKRALCVFDGPRRLWKDDMMLDADHEVRFPLAGAGPDGRQWITDLDVHTIRRAEAVLNATDEEKGPWIQDEDEELERLMAP